MRSLRRALLIGSAILGAAVFWLARGDELDRQAPPSAATEPAADEPPRRRMLTDDDARRVAELNKRMAALEEQAKFADTPELARAILEICTRALGPDHWQTAEARLLLRTTGQLAALPGAAQAEVAEAMKLAREADQLYRKGRYADALPVARRVLDIHRRHLGDEHVGVSAASSFLGRCLDQVGKDAEAESLHRQALAINRRVRGDEHPFTARTYNGMGHHLHIRGNFPEAELLYRQALAIHRKVLGDKHADTVSSYNNLGGVLLSQGKGGEAEVLHRQALAIRRRVLGEDHADTALSYNNLAMTLDAQGKHAEALLLLEKALAVRRHVLTEDHPDTAQSYNNLALNLHRQGMPVEAASLLRKALATHRKLLGEDHRETARSISNLAGCLLDQGEYDEAMSLQEKALAVRQRRLGENHPDTALSYYNLAVTLRGRRKCAEAEPLFRKALDIQRRALGEGHERTAMSYLYLAYSLHAQGKHAEVQPVLRAAAASFEVARLHFSQAGLERAALGASHSPLPFLVTYLAGAGKDGEAWQRLEHSLARGLLDEWSARVAQPLSAEEKKRQGELLGKLARLNQQIVPLLSDKEPAEASRTQERELQKQRAAVEAELARLEADLAGRQVYDLKRIQSCLPADAALVAWVDVQGRQESDSLTEHWACLLRRTGPPVWVRLAGSGREGVWTEEDSQLPERVRRIVSNRLVNFDEGTRGVVQKLAGQRLAPLERHLRGGGGLPAVRQLIVLPSPWMTGIPVEALADQYTVSYAPSGTLFAKLQEQRQKGLEKVDKAAPARLLALGDPVFRQPDAPAKPPPLPDHGVLVTQVLPRTNADRSGVRVNDVLLGYAGVKLSGPDDIAKAVGKGREIKPAEQGVPITLWRDGKTLELTALPDLAGMKVSPKPAAEVIRSRHEGDALLQRTRGPAFEPLHGSRREVNAIAPLFAHADKLLGSDASTQRLADLAAAGRLKDYRFLHLATHAVTDRDRHLMSALILSQDQLPDQLVQALAGKEPDDGRLTAKQILDSWKLDAELVTLSACQTALGRFSLGEGYVGFAQALLLAGARSLVLSLWMVDDTATALLMTRFYQNLLGTRTGEKPMPKAEALKEAKHWLRNLSVEEAAKLEAGLPPVDRGKLRDRPAVPLPPSARRFEHPYYWSGFILIGDRN